MMASTAGEQTIAPPANEDASVPIGHLPSLSRSQTFRTFTSGMESGDRHSPVSGDSLDSNSETDSRGRSTPPQVAFRRPGRVTHVRVRLPVEPEPGIERIVVTTPLPLPRRKTAMKKAIVVYYDIPEGSVEESADPFIGGKSGPPNINQRPWLVQFNSSFLVSCIAKVMGFKVEGSTTTHVVSPFKELVPFEKGYISLLAEWTEKLQTDQSLDNQPKIKLLQDLLEVIRVDLGSVLEIRRSLLERKLKTVSFENIWYLFQPGTIVWCKDQGREQLYTVYEVMGDQDQLGANNYRSQSRASSYRRTPASSARFYQSSYDDAYNYHAHNPSQSDYDQENNHSRTGDLQEDAEYPPFMLKCYYAVYDGALIGPACRDLSIPYFSGEKAVIDLPVYPINHHPEEATILHRFQERGRKLLSWKGHLHYEGPTLPPPHGYTSGFPFWSEEVDQEVYADPKTGYRFMNPRHRPVMSKPAEGPFIGMTIRTEGELSKIGTRAEVLSQFREASLDRQRSTLFLRSQPIGCRIVSREKALELKGYLQLLPYQVLCFIFRKRCWSYLDVDLLRQIDKSEDAANSGFNDLVIPDTYRDLLISVIESYSPNSKLRRDASQPKISSQMDIVRGKGRGLIILLHGPPGVGKTSTAETIAAYTKRPLYVLTSGDIGLTSSDIEANLSYHFNLASSWGCIMLIDEADVFLMKRDWHDIERNALVSVFLRVLEYYSGILFLTTNRTGVIDEAFKSRMHLYLRYPSIDLNSTKLIWGKLLDRIARENKENKIKIEFDRSALLKYASEHFESHKEKRTTWNARRSATPSKQPLRCLSTTGCTCWKIMD